jgi:regulator of sigma E protease
MSFLSGFPHYAVSFLLVLTVLVFFHELGHFWVARRNGVRVETFSIGFGQELFGFNDRHGTRWKFSLLPLGGYVKMFGEGDALPTSDGKERVLTPEERAVSFSQKTVGQRAAIVVAGPVANFLLAIVLLAILFIGYGTPSNENIVGEVVANGAAAQAGVLSGDRIVEIDGQRVERFDQVSAQVKAAGDNPMKLVIDRDGQRVEITARAAVPADAGPEGRKQLGISSAYVRSDPLTAVGDAVQQTWRMTGLILRALGEVITGERSAKELGGVLTIGKLAGDAANMGLDWLLNFAALLSINLGLINLFPIPMLDGGHLAFYAVEAVRGRPLGLRAQEWGFRVGLALVLSLMLFATWNDLVNLKVLAYLKNLVT